MICGDKAVNTTFRYNISVNDGKGTIAPFGNPEAHIYNNVFYLPENTGFIRSDKSGGSMLVENNIIYNAGDSQTEGKWYESTTDDKVDYSNNVYYNYDAKPEEDAAGQLVAKGTAIFAGELSQAPSNTDGTLKSHSDPEKKSLRYV